MNKLLFYVLLVSASTHIWHISGGDGIWSYLNSTKDYAGAVKQSIQKQTDQFKERASSFYTAAQNKTGLNAYKDGQAWNFAKKGALFSTIGAFTSFGLKNVFDAYKLDIDQPVTSTLTRALQNGFAETSQPVKSLVGYCATKQNAKTALTAGGVFGLACMMYYAYTSEWTGIAHIKSLVSHYFNQFFANNDSSRATEYEAKDTGALENNDNSSKEIDSESDAADSESMQEDLSGSDFQELAELEAEAEQQTITHLGRLEDSSDSSEEAGSHIQASDSESTEETFPLDASFRPSEIREMLGKETADLTRSSNSSNSTPDALDEDVSCVTDSSESDLALECKSDMRPKNNEPSITSSEDTAYSASQTSQSIAQIAANNSCDMPLKFDQEIGYYRNSPEEEKQLRQEALQELKNLEKQTLDGSEHNSRLCEQISPNPDERSRKI